MRAMTSVAMAILAAGLFSVSATASPTHHGELRGRLINTGRVPKHSDVVELARAGKIVALETVGGSGRFHFTERPGTYRLRSNRCGGVTVKIMPGDTTRKNIFCVFH